jgi:hypothetical protein
MPWPAIERAVLLAVAQAQRRPLPASQTFRDRCQKLRQSAQGVLRHRQTFSGGLAPWLGRSALLCFQVAKAPPPPTGLLPHSNRPEGDRRDPARVAQRIGLDSTSSSLRERLAPRANHRSIPALAHSQRQRSRRPGAHRALAANSLQLWRNSPKTSQAGRVATGQAQTVHSVAVPSREPTSLIRFSAF